QTLWLLGRIDETLAEVPALVERIAATGNDGLVAYAASAASILCSLTGRTGVGAATGEPGGREGSDPGVAAELLGRARGAAPWGPSAPMIDANIVIAEAALAVATGDEPRAAALLDASFRRSPPLGTGMAALVQFTTLPLWYVLVPETRPVWE